MSKYDHPTYGLVLEARYYRALAKALAQSIEDGPMRPGGSTLRLYGQPLEDLLDPAKLPHGIAALHTYLEL